MKPHSWKEAYHRAFDRAFDRTSFSISFAVLILTGLTYTLFNFPTRYLVSWNFLGMNSLSLSISSFWTFLGFCILARRYECGYLRKRITWQYLLGASPKLIQASAIFSGFFWLASLGMWLVLVFKHTLLQVPYLGVLLSILLAWLPFLVLMFLKLLPLLLLSGLFFLVPLVSLYSMGLTRALRHTLLVLRRHLLDVLSHFLVGLIPLALTLFLISSLNKHTMGFLGYGSYTLIGMLQRAVLLLSTALVLSFPQILFSHMSVESWRLLGQALRKDGNDHDKEGILENKEESSPEA